MRTYTIVVEHDSESGWYVGEVGELPGCYTQAEDLAALTRNIREAIATYLKMRGSGEEPASELVGTWRIEVAA